MGRRAVVASLAVVIAAGVTLGPERRVDACGPDFPTNMLIRRADALATMWDGSFAEEAGKLVPVSANDRELFSRPAKLVAPGALELALYATAAAKFHSGDREGAARGFETVLALPASERPRFSVAAAYSLGRARMALWDRRAIASFRQVRELVRAGFADDQDLARSSLGEEAFAMARWSRWDSTDEASADTIAASTASIRLYAQQAGLGDPNGATSLLMVVRGLDARDRADLYRDDVGASLIALYFYTRGHELSDEERALWKKELAHAVTRGTRGAAYMAAASYRAGEWKAAAAFASLSRAPIATWVKAKLALRDGDRAKAEALLREVERAGLNGNTSAAEIASYTLDADPSSLVRAELGLLALSSDRFTEAAEWFGKGNHMVEASYVAERAMSMDELLAAVQRTRPQRAATPVLPDGTSSSDACSAWSSSTEQERAYCWGTLLVDIYARRLLRVHRYDDALDAFGTRRPVAVHDVDGDETTENDPDPAGTFVAEMKRAAATTGIERAEHLFYASLTLRRYGMEIAGTEVGPDWRIYHGDMGDTLCLPSPVHGYTRFAVRDEEGWHWPEDGMDCLLPSRADAALVTPLEAARVIESAPEVDQRFSYRYVASKLAEEAAGLVPPRSQAYAATLCWAAKYASRDRARTDALQAMYARNGAAGFEIGANCEQPDFARARRFDDEQAQRHAEKIVAAQKTREWTWPRVRDAVWRRRGWLLVPLAVVLAGLLLVGIGRAYSSAKSSTRSGSSP
ncbi:MAG: hypothetical protein ACKV2T_19860 [Kofleriaceae bacterium]